MNRLSNWTTLEAGLHGIALSHRFRHGQVPVLMVHGIGPGTNGDVNFTPLVERLSQRCAVHLIDLAGFGQSDRLQAAPFFDVPFWLDQLDAAVTRIAVLHQRQPLLVGNSVGGALALKLASRRHGLPHVVAIAAPAAAIATPELRAFWTAPRDAEALAAAMQPMTGPADPPHPDLVQRRLAAFLSGDYADYFAAMLADPEACLARAIAAPAELARIAAHVTLLHGDLDRACPPGATLDMRNRLPQADLILLAGCGHNLIFERPARIAALIEFLAGEIELS